MIVDWIYSNPTWLWGTIVVVLFTGVSCAGLLAFHRLVHLNVRRAHNDLAGFTIAVIGVLYAVLLAFIAIATWESFNRASDIVEAESDYAGIYLDTRGLPDAKGKPIRDATARYVGVVIDQEWPEQRAGKTPEQGWKPLRDIDSAIAMIDPETRGEAVIEAELFKEWNQLYQSRSSRLSAVQGHVAGVVWWIIFLGAAITIGYTYFFGYQNFALHVAMTATMAATIGLVVVLIMALDWPFRREISVGPEPFVMTRQSWVDMTFDTFPPTEAAKKEGPLSDVRERWTEAPSCGALERHRQLRAGVTFCDAHHGGAFVPADLQFRCPQSVGPVQT